MTALELGERETAPLERDEQSPGFGRAKIVRTTTRLGRGRRS
jgi:hypothetical protein